MISKQGGHFGYLQIDHSNSPGLPNAPGGKVMEADTYRCNHCHRTVIRSPRKKPLNICRKCMAPICHMPACNAGCLPLDKVFDKAEAVAHKNPGLVENAIKALRSDILGKP